MAAAVAATEGQPNVKLLLHRPHIGSNYVQDYSGFAVKGGVMMGQSLIEQEENVRQSWGLQQTHAPASCGCAGGCSCVNVIAAYMCFVVYMFYQQ